MIYSFLLIFFRQDCIKEFIYFLLEDVYHLHMFGFKVIFLHFSKVQIFRACCGRRAGV